MTSLQSLDVAFQTLLNGFGTLDILSGTIRRIALRELELLRNNEATRHEAGLKIDTVSMHSMNYRDISTNAPVFYDSRKRNSEELTEDLVSYVNKQYQWALVEAFELFENFVESCYLECVRLNPNGETAKPKGGLSSKLKILRSYIPSLVVYEVRNAREMNYRSVIVLVEMLRHVIVHNGGRINDEQEFFRKLASRTQAVNNGTHDNDIENTVKFFLFKRPRWVEIHLLEEADNKRTHMRIDRLDTLLGWLLTYSSLLKARLAGAPFYSKQEFPG